MGQVSQLSRAQGVGAKRWDVGNVKPQICLWIVHSVGACVIARIQSMTSLVFGSGDNIQAMPQNSDGTGEVELIRIKGESCSMGNFARRLVCKLFSFDELINCMGSKGKLDKRHWTKTILF